MFVWRFQIIFAGKCYLSRSTERHHIKIREHSQQQLLGQSPVDESLIMLWEHSGDLPLGDLGHVVTIPVTILSHLPTLHPPTIAIDLNTIAVLHHPGFPASATNNIIRRNKIKSCWYRSVCWWDWNIITQSYKFNVQFCQSRHLQIHAQKMLLTAVENCF